MNRVFIVRPFGKQKGIDFEAIEARLIQPALREVGLEGATTTVIVEAGNIREDMFRLLVTADLVIADISIHNANVFYELGIRHGLRARSTFLLRARVNKLEVPFDLKTDRYLAYDAARPKAKVAELAQALRETMESTRKDSPVYAMLPNLEPPNPCLLTVVPRDFHDEVEAAAGTAQRGDLRLLANEARGFEWEGEGLRVIGRAQFLLKAISGAIETYEWLRALAPDDIDANRRLGTLYQKAGDLPRSNQAIDRVIASRSAGPRKLAEALALRASNVKSAWIDRLKRDTREASPTQARENALRAGELVDAARKYKEGFTRDLNHFYSGLNALSLTCIRVELARALPELWSSLFDTPAIAARELQAAIADYADLEVAVRFALGAARKELDRTTQPADDDRIWIPISEADYEFVCGSEPMAVAQRYEQALTGAPSFAVETVRTQLQLFEALRVRPEFAAAALRSVTKSAPAQATPTTPPRVLLFTGHMIDEKRRKPRFPNTPGAEAEARRMIREQVVREQQLAADGIVGLASGACGGDILFHEVCAELGIPTELYLALPEEQFRVESVARGGPDWIERFSRLCRRAPSRILGVTRELPRWLRGKPGYGIWQRNNLWMLFNALARNSTNLTLIALWDQGKADGPGGTEDLVAQVKKRGQRIVILPAEELSKFTPRRSAARQR